MIHTTLFYSQFDENVNKALRKACDYDDAMHLVRVTQIVDLKVDIISRGYLSRLNCCSFLTNGHH